jgi:amidase
MTIGTDQGGSIRIPASWSGVVGLKPTYGLVPYTGVMSIDPTVDHVGPLARTVGDAALLLETIAGKDPLDQRQTDAIRLEPYGELLNKPVAGLRIGVVREGFQQPGGESDVNAAVKRAISILERQGAKAGEISIPEHRDASDWMYAIVPEGMATLARGNLMSMHHAGAYMPALADHFCHATAAGRFEPALTVKFILILGRYLNEKYHGRLYAKAQNFRAALTARYDAAFAQFDALAMPTTPMKAPPMAASAPYSMISNVAPFNITRHPAISVPCAMSAGLPVGLMLAGRHFEESTILRLAHAYEQSVNWREA